LDIQVGDDALQPAVGSDILHKPVLVIEDRREVDFYPA
jgi:hypothetical protein